MKTAQQRQCIFAALLTLTVLGSSIGWTQDETSEKKALLRALNDGTWEEQQNTIALLKEHGRETPYRQMIIEWIRKWHNTSGDEIICKIVAFLNDEEFYEAALARLRELELRWPDGITDNKRSDSIVDIGLFIEELFTIGKYNGAVPFIENILVREVPQYSEKWARAMMPFRPASAPWVRMRAARALAHQKGNACAPFLRKVRNATIAWAQGICEAVEAHKRFAYRDLEMCFDLDVSLQKFLHEIDKVIAAVAWTEERPKYVEKIQSSDPYDRYCAMEVFCHVQDRTALKYVVPLLDDPRDAWMPFSAQGQKSLDRRDRYEVGRIDGCRVTDQLSSSARWALERLTGVYACLSTDGQVMFRDRHLLLGEFGMIPLETHIQAWKKWWLENMHKPEYNE